MQLTIKQAAELLGVSESQVHRWIRDRGMPAVLFNEQYRLNRVSLMDWAQRNQVQLPVQELDAEATPLHLADALERGGIHRDLFGASRQQVVAAAVDRLLLPQSVDRDLLREMILARAAHDSTAIGNGIALPHARYPFVAAVPAPILGLFFLSAPVDFGAADGIAMTTLFVLVSPTVRTHLHMLSRVARALTGEMKRPIHTRATYEEILAAARAADARSQGSRP